MAADNSIDQAETYILATLAAWAGDADYALSQLRAMSDPPHEPAETMAGGGLKAVNVIQYAAAFQRKELEDALRRSREAGEFPVESVPSEVGHAEQATEEVVRADVVVTKHLRGVMRPVSIAEYELRAFLTDLSWEDELLRRAAGLAGSTHPPGDSYLGDGIHKDGEGRSVSGGRWVERERDIFKIVSVTDLGLVRVRGFWVGSEIRESWRMVREAFAETLNRIDPPTG
jgi:hypothetical protein